MDLIKSDISPADIDIVTSPESSANNIEQIINSNVTEGLNITTLEFKPKKQIVGLTFVISAKGDAPDETVALAILYNDTEKPVESVMYIFTCINIQSLIL